MNNLSGRCIKGYELQEQIGGGGFGVVYRATQPSVGREVAVKVILPRLANQPEFIRRFEIGAQTIARLEHMHIAPLYDYWRDPDGTFLVMRYFRGGSLADALRSSPYDLQAAALLLDQVASALMVAHRNNVVHRDLKPGNILLDEDGNAYLTDFGIAKDISRPDSGLTGVDALVGSLDYISPEQARSELITPRTDLYSLGVVLYEVLTGAHPFPGLSSVERLYKHLNDPLPLIDRSDHDTWDSINAVIQRATAKDPAHRFSDALAMAAALREAARLDIPTADDHVVEQLTRREQDILQRMIAGLSNKEIAQELFVEISTVKWYITQVFRKLGVRSRMQCIVRARELNLVVGGDTDSGLLTVTGGATSTHFLPQLENPYKGLRSFQPADTRDFFGREKLTAALVARMGETGEYSRFLAVVGPSGSGKSSVVRAGLIPALWRGDLRGSEKWFVVDLLPGTRPLDELEVALMRVAADQARNLHDPLTRDQRGLLRAAQLILPDDDSELVVIIDQFEEVFTLVEDETARQCFLDLLYTAITAPRSRVRVVITLRADFYDKPLHYPEFGEMIRCRMETILPLSADELQRAISKPAEQVGISFEEGLVATIVSDIHYQPGALPLLQYALTELFENREGRLLTHRAYEAIGRTTGALARRAEVLFDELDQSGWDTARQMFLRLVTLGEGSEDTRRRVPRSELLAVAANPDVMDEVIDTYTTYRLLSLDHDPATRSPVVEVAHEAILREWGRLREWLDESRYDIRQQRLLASAAADWRNSDCDPSYLLHGARLEQVEEWANETSLALTPEEREFLHTSISQQHQQEQTERERQAHELTLAQQAAAAAQQAEASQRKAANRLRALVAGLGVFLAVALGLSLFAFGKEREANDSRQQAEREAGVNHSLVLAANAREEHEVGRGDLALALALEAVTIEQPPGDAKNTLTNVALSVGTRRVLTGHAGDVRAVAFSHDGSLLLSAGCALPVDEGEDCDQGELILWNVSEGTIQRRWQGHTGRINAIVFGPFANQEGSLLAVSASADRMLIVWDVLTGTKIRRLEGHTGAVNDVAFVPGQSMMLSASDDATAILWDVTSGEILRRFEDHTARVNTVAVSADGMRAITASADRTIIEWDINPESPTFGQAIQQLEGHESEVTGAVYIPDGTAILSYSPDLSFRLWDMQTGKETRQRTLGAYGKPMAISPNGHTVIFSIGEDLYFWDTEVWWQDQLAVGHTLTVWDVAFSPDGSLVATASGDGTIRLWNMGAQEENHRYRLGTPAFALEVSSDGSRLVVGEADQGDVWLFDTTAAALVRTLQGSGSVAPGAIALDPGGQYALVGTLEIDSQSRIARLTLWDLDAGVAIRDFEARTFPWRSVAISPDGQSALAGTQDFSDDDLGGELFLLNLNTGQVIRQFATTQDITSIAFSQDGKRAIASSCYSASVTLWDVETGQSIREFAEQPGCVLNTIFGPDETTLIAATNDGSIVEWSIETGEVVRQFVGHDGPVWSLNLGPGGQIMASGSSDGSVMLWNYATGEMLRRFEGHMGWIFDVGFSADGEHLYSASADGTVREWQVSDWELGDLIEWVHDNRYVRDFTCEERARYRIEPRCE